MFGHFSSMLVNNAYKHRPVRGSKEDLFMICLASWCLKNLLGINEEGTFFKEGYLQQFWVQLCNVLHFQDQWILCYTSVINITLLSASYDKYSQVFNKIRYCNSVGFSFHFHFLICDNCTLYLQQASFPIPKDRKTHTSNTDLISLLNSNVMDYNCISIVLNEFIYLKENIFWGNKSILLGSGNNLIDFYHPELMWMAYIELLYL